MRLQNCLLAALLLGAVNAGAQEPAAPAGEPTPASSPPATEPETKTAPATDREPLEAPPAEATKASGPSPDSFKPSEEISEDLSVSYPVDI